MEMSNSTDPVSEENEKGVDICGLNPHICGMEAGCHVVGDGYICLCEKDLEPADPVTFSCDRTKAITHPSSSTDVPDRNIAPTESSFGSHQLMGMLIPPKSGNDRNITQSSTANLDQGSPSTVIVACILVFLLLSIAGGFIFYLRKIRRRRRRSSLGKCMQQYIANPNYYSVSVNGLEISQENVSLLEEVGEGFFGKVYKGLYTTNSGVTLAVAVKTLKDNYNPEALRDFEREVDIMSAFCHENILKLLGVVVRESQASPWMIFEFMQHGDLAHLLRSNCPTSQHRRLELNQMELIWMSTQIASGMSYLSSQHFVHRDLATRNCLVGDNLAVKISDFGLSRDIYTSDYYKVGGSRMLPVRWMSPESITYGKFSLESDVWSYGVVLWEIFTYAKQPYYGYSNDEVVKLILQGILLSPPDNCPAFICQVMAGCWKTEPQDRLTFPEVLEMLSSSRETFD